MKIATWNVNSIRVRLPQLLMWLAEKQPDVVALQETKTMDEKFPKQEIENAGYRVIFSGQKAYNGVAILSRELSTDVTSDILQLDPQKRLLAATINDVRLLNLYVPNGESISSEKYSYKLNWLTQVTDYIKQQLTQFPKMVILGDFNIAPDERDVYDPQLWENRVIFSNPERAALQKILQLGLKDTFRLFNQETGHFTWWDYRNGSYWRNSGLRIDHIFASGALATQCKSCVIDRDIRKQKQPSDHVPITAEFE